MPVPGFVKIIATTLILQVANPQSFAIVWEPLRMIVSCASLPGWQKLSLYHVALAYVLVKLVMYSEVRLSIPVFIISSSQNCPVLLKKTLDGPLQTRQHTTMPKKLTYLYSNHQCLRNRGGHTDREKNTTFFLAANRKGPWVGPKSATTAL